MATDSEKIRRFIRFADSYKDIMGNVEFTEEALCTLVDTAKKMTNVELSDEEEEIIFKELEYKYQIRVTPVITSYSIHYTKLYDDFTFLICVPCCLIIVGKQTFTRSYTNLIFIFKFFEYNFFFFV